MSEITELIELPPAETAVDVFTDTDKLDAILDQVRQKVVGIVYDMGKRSDRDLCRSDAFKVARCKSAAKDLGSTVARKVKELPKQIDAGRRYLEDGLEEIQKQVRQPLTEWEEAENARVDAHKVNVAWIVGFGDGIDRDVESATLKACIEELRARVIDESWEEFADEARHAKTKALDTLHTALAAREKYEAEQAELAELRRKQAEQERKDREARIAQEAAEKARADAEAAAQAEREAAAKREAAAQAAAEQAERDRLEAIERQKQAEAQVEAEKLAAEQRARDAAEAARRAEVERQEREKAAAEAEQRRREADTAHKAGINNAALAAFIEHGLPETCAKEAVILIAKGLIPAVRIQY